jgi:hypothetical protein
MIYVGPTPTPFTKWGFYYGKGVVFPFVKCGVVVVVVVVVVVIVVVVVFAAFQEVSEGDLFFLSHFIFFF